MQPDVWHVLPGQNKKYRDGQHDVEGMLVEFLWMELFEIEFSEANTLDKKGWVISAFDILDSFQSTGISWVKDNNLKWGEVWWSKKAHKDPQRPLELITLRCWFAFTVFEKRFVAHES